MYRQILSKSSHHAHLEFQVSWTLSLSRLSRWWYHPGCASTDYYCTKSSKAVDPTSNLNCQLDLLLRILDLVPL